MPVSYGTRKRCTRVMQWVQDVGNALPARGKALRLFRVVGILQCSTMRYDPKTAFKFVRFECPDSESTSGRLNNAPTSETESGSAYRQLQRPSPTRANDPICEDHTRSFQTQLLPTGKHGDHLLTADANSPKRPPSTPPSASGSVRDRVMMLEERTRAEMDSL